MPTFHHNPTTVTIRSNDGDIVWIGRAPTYGPDPGGEAPMVISLPIRGEVKYIPIATMIEDGSSGAVELSRK